MIRGVFSGKAKISLAEKFFPPSLKNGSKGSMRFRIAEIKCRNSSDSEECALEQDFFKTAYFGV